MEHRLQKYKLTSCVILPTYTLHGFVVFFSCKIEVTLLFVTSLKVKGQVNELQQFFVQPKAFEPLMLET